jgi:NAD(P)-dependent dehydrogenase (short-subunit alcohol dehydrogenase family)
VDIAVDRFGKVDILVNNAGNSDAHGPLYGSTPSPPA